MQIADPTLNHIRYARAALREETQPTTHTSPLWPNLLDLNCFSTRVDKETIIDDKLPVYCEFSRAILIRMRPSTRDEFEVAIMCALPREADAVEALFDETYDKSNQLYGAQPGDTNVYTNGKLGPHDVVLCYLPGMGKGNAASAASSLRVSYPSVQLALLIGICGAVRFTCDGTPIALGDVILSVRVVEYDFGRQYSTGFERKKGIKETSGRHTREIKTLSVDLRTQ